MDVGNWENNLDWQEDFSCWSRLHVCRSRRNTLR